MSRNGNSANISVIAGARIAGPATYTPSYMPQGAQKPISAKAEFNVYTNKGDKKQSFRITAWGGMADAIARGGATGKEITIFAELGSYEGRVWMPMPDGTRQVVTKPDGTPLLITKNGLTVQNIIWGRDSSKTIASELQAGVRPQDWDRPGTPGNQQWLQVCATRNAAQYVQGQPQFGYANVDETRVPQGAQIVMPQAANNAQAPAAQPQAQGNQVIVNGQQMGYAMPANNAPAANTLQHVANPGAVQNTMPAQPTQPGAYTPNTQPAAQPAANGFPQNNVVM